MTATTDVRLVEIFDLSDEFLILLHHEGVRTVSQALRMFERRRGNFHPPTAASVLFEMSFFKAEWTACEAAAKAIAGEESDE